MGRRLLALLAVLALFVAACGDDDDTATDDPDEGTNDTSTDDGGDEGASLDPEGAFRFGDTLPITTLDPHKSTGAGYNVWLFPVYDRLIHITPDGELEPGLATEWEFTDDGTALELTLREDVTFHDGTPFDAEAVKANLERGLTHEESAVANDLAIFESVEVVDDTHVTITLTEPNATAPYVLTERGGAIASPEAFDTLDLEPVGTGMYTVTAFEPSVSASYSRNDDYWDPEAAASATMEFTTIPDSLQRANALRSGEIDATILDAPQVQEIESAGFTVDSAPNNQFFHLQMNRTRAQLDDVLVRQAINHAIDREALVEGLLFGLGDPAVQPFPEGSVAFDEETGADFYEYDPDRARQLLEDAGASDLSFAILTLNVPSYVQLAETLQAQLGEVGIDAEVTQTTNVAVDFYIDATGDTTAINWTGRPDPAMTVQSLYSDSGGSNPGRHTTPEVMDLYEQSIDPTLDEAERNDVLKQLSAQVTEDALGGVLYFPYANLAYSEDVVGFQNWITGKLEFRGVGMRG